jgi:hypothetical protein
LLLPLSLPREELGIFHQGKHKFLRKKVAEDEKLKVIGASNGVKNKFALTKSLGVEEMFEDLK